MIIYINSFKMFLRQLLRDKITLLILFAPLLYSFAFRFGAPALDIIINNYTGKLIIREYYVAIDMLFSMLTPMMLCFSSSMIMLEEMDEGISRYEVITPLGKSGYIFSRLIIPAIISLIVTALLLFIFRLSDITLLVIIFISILSSFFSVVMTLFIISYANNKVEGMALAKLSGLFMIGAFVPLFMTSNIQYLFSFLPSFWIAKTIQNINFGNILMGLITNTVWFVLLFNVFNKKLEK